MQQAADEFLKTFIKLSSASKNWSLGFNSRIISLIFKHLRAPNDLKQELPSDWSTNYAGHWGHDGLFHAKTWIKDQLKSQHKNWSGWSQQIPSNQTIPFWIRNCDEFKNKVTTNNFHDGIFYFNCKKKDILMKVS